MRSIRFNLLLLAIVLGLSITANAAEIIKDRSPDGRFGLQLTRDEEGNFAPALIDIASHKHLIDLNLLAYRYETDSHLLWSPDSKRVAYNEDNHHGGDTTTYQQKGNGFEEVKLPDLPLPKPKHVQKGFEPSLLAERWLDNQTLLVAKSVVWVATNDEAGEFEKTARIKFASNGEASIENVKTTSARELKDRATARRLVESGNAKSSSGDRAGATADFSRAIQLDPKSADAYNDRGTEKQFAADLDGALADFNHAIEINRMSPNPYYNRGGIYFLKSDWNKAILDLRRHDELNHADAEAPALIWIAQVRLGQKEAADRELAKFISDHPDWADSWNTKIDNFLLGKVSEQQLLAAFNAFEEKKQGEQQCEAWYYIGVKRLMNGDKAGAEDAFQKSIATGEKSRNEYDFAKAELKQLGK